MCLAATIGISLGQFWLGNRGGHVCSNPQRVTYTQKVPKMKLVPYQQYSYFKGWETKYRHEPIWEDQVKRGFKSFILSLKSLIPLIKLS